MRIRTDLPRAVRLIEHVWIPLSDGCKLAARIWLPVDAEEHPVPAILEYLPYRKNDGTIARDAHQHPYFGGHGYAAIRVDMRGSGDSDGLLLDEYLPQEQDDALEVLAWIAAQPWCDGGVGIIGISWGGFNGLQIAARQPPELKAVISLCSTDDRYADDVHYMGGCLLSVDALSWASRMFTYNARPPDPEVVGERWRAMWFDRMEHTPPFIDAWLRHQRRDAFWKHGSVCEDFAAIRCPVYAVGGWADAYTNAVFRLLAGLPGPRKGLIGPWPHQYPELETALPGPRIGFLQECLRWWDYWLKGIDTGIMDEPMLRVWMQDSVEPHVFFSGYTERPGRWVSEAGWPSPRIGSRAYALNPQTLDDLPGRPDRLDVRGTQSCGLDAGTWCPYGLKTDWPPDQRAEDGVSLCFTSAPLAEPMEILGFPTVTLELAADRPCALIAARLCDVAPTGASTLVTRGLLNLTHRESHETPTPLEPGRRYTVTVQLNAIAHVLPAGHRWRLAISPTYWPWAWPSPEPVTLSIFTGGTSALHLPVRDPRPEDQQLAPFEPAEGTPPAPTEVLSMATHSCTVRRDVAAGRFELTDHHDGPYVRLRESGREYGGSYTCTYSIVEGGPLAATATCESSSVVGRGAWQTRVATSSVLSADAGAFHVTCVLHGYEGHTRVFAKTWTFTVPRDLV